MHAVLCCTTLRRHCWLQSGSPATNTRVHKNEHPCCLKQVLRNCQCLWQAPSRQSGFRAERRQQSHLRALRGYVKAVTFDHAVKQARLEHAGRVVLLGQVQQGVKLGAPWGDQATCMQEGPVKVFAPVRAALEPVKANQQSEQLHIINV